MQLRLSDHDAPLEMSHLGGWHGGAPHEVSHLGGWQGVHPLMHLAESII